MGVSLQITSLCLFIIIQLIEHLKMKPRPSSKHKLSKPKPSLLEQQTQKMQSKLQQLKKYLKDKKSTQNSSNKLLKVKQMTNSTSRFTKQIKQFAGEGKKKEDELTRFYKQLKMEMYANTLKQIGITTMKQLKQLTQQEIEKLPIPPGYRIKIKKSIIKTSPSKDIVKIDQVEDIEEIILKRQKTKQDQKINQKHKLQQLNQFIPLYEENSNTDQMNLGEERQKHFIQKQYLKQYFEVEQKSQQKIPKSCLKEISIGVQSKSKSKIIKKVRWNPSVQNYSADENHKTYPKQSFVQNKQTTIAVQQPLKIKQIASQNKILQQHEKIMTKYCWQCFKRIVQPLQSNQKQFCSRNCQEKYIKSAFISCSKCNKEVLKTDCIQNICQACLEELSQTINLNAQQALIIDQYSDQQLQQQVDLQF